MTIVVWTFFAIGLIFLFEIPQNIYYLFKPDKKPEKGALNGRADNSNRADNRDRGNGDRTGEYADYICDDCGAVFRRPYHGDDDSDNSGDL